MIIGAMQFGYAGTQNDRNKRMNSENLNTAITTLEVRAARAALPFAILEEMGVPCGYERSVKASTGRLLANRYLIGFSPDKVSRSQLAAGLLRMKMPESRMAEFFSHLYGANLIFFGFEENGESYTYKVYAEFYDLRRSELDSGLVSNEPMLIHTGYKWNPMTQDIGHITKYWWFPSLTPPSIERRLADMFGERRSVSYEFATGVLEQAIQRTESLLYMEVNEDDGRRQSFNLNVYAANMRVLDIGALWRAAAAAYDIPSDDFSRTFAIVSQNLLGNVSGGISNDGDDFLTVYFEPNTAV